MMVQTLLVYGFLFGIMFFFAEQYQVKKEWKYIIFAILAFALVMGMRYGVGTDFPNYYSFYERIKHGREPLVYYDIEPGLRFIADILGKIGASHTIMWGFIAFIQLYFICLPHKGNNKIFLYLFFVFLFGCVWLTFDNGIRQSIAFSIYAYALVFIINRKHLPFIALMLLAYLFHSSSIILLLLYPFYLKKFEWFTNVKIELIVFFISLVLMNFDIIGNYLNVFTNFVDLLNYRDGVYSLDSYGIEIYNNLALKDKGLGFILLILIDFFNILYSKKVKDYFKDPYLATIYNLYYIGIIINYTFITSHLIIRLNWYFYMFGFIFSAYTLSFLCANKLKKPMLAYMMCYFLTFAAYMNKMNETTAAYYFNWQQTEFWSDNRFLHEGK